MKLSKLVLGHWLSSSLARRRTNKPNREDQRALAPFRDRFRAVCRLGSGSQGRVLLCQDLKHPDIPVTVKLAHDDPKSLKALSSEAVILRQLRDTGYVPELRALIHRKSKIRGFASRFVDGITLEQVIETRQIGDRDLDEQSLLRLACDLTEAVLTILRNDVIHRDLKPQNVLISPKGQVHILDFGLACPRIGHRFDGAVSGTLNYASPEQIRAERLDERSDLFSLGVVLYELATQRGFFLRCARNSSTSENAETQDSRARNRNPDIREILDDRRNRLIHPPSLNGIPPKLAALINRLIQGKTSLRANIPEVSRRLEAIREDCERQFA